MKKNFYLLVLSTSICLFNNLHAQNWVNGGNTLLANGSFGTNSNHSVIFETNGADRGRITNGGNWGIGTTGTSSKLTINSAAGVSPLRAQIAGTTRFVVNGNGGVAIGGNVVGPANGLYVAGNTGIGTNFPAFKLHVAGTIYGINTAGQGVFAVGAEAVRGQGIATGVYGSAINNGGTGVYGIATNSSGGYGVYGYSSSTTQGYGGVYGVGIVGVYGLGNAGGGQAVQAYTNFSGSWGIYTYSGQDIGIVASTGNVNSYAGFFSGKVYSSGGYTSSDRKLKQDIADMSSGMEIINKLQPKTYNFRQDGNYKLLNLPQGKHYGLIAQDVEPLLPNIIAEAEFNTARVPQPEDKPGVERKGEIIDFKTINYIELVPIVVKGMQELYLENQSLKEEIALLKEMVNKLDNQGNVYPKTAWMKQNTPNPVSISTRIQYSIPEEVRTARILITNVKGQQLKVYNVNGEGAINFNVGTLPSGTYNYSLVTDGKTISTKKLVIAR